MEKETKENTDKRARSKNFTEEESRRLLALIYQYRFILENGKTDGATSRQKNEAWAKIHEAFNRDSTECYRSINSLKLRYENTKRDVKKELADEKMHRKSTGGDSPRKPQLLTKWVSSKSVMQDLVEEEVKLRMTLMKEKHKEEIEEIRKRKELLDLKIEKLKSEKLKRELF